MQIHVSFDYELFFGSASGTVEKCILEPTQQLMDIAAKHKVPFIFFVDAGYLYRLKNYLHIESCKQDYLRISEQLIQLVTLGHEIALHIHPHWKDCRFENDAWRIDTTRYKLADFPEKEILDIVTKYHQAIKEITGKACKSYRAGGWCIQPFEPIKKALAENGIYTDSTIYYKGFHESKAHAYDFRKAPDLAEWNFEEDPCVEHKAGAFKEIPVTPDRIPFLFYWQLYFKMRSDPAVYKPIGDGKWLADRKRIYKHFYTATDHFACCDGFFASRLKPVLSKAEQQQKARMMILSHPKSMAPYSFTALDEFITFAKSKRHTFDTITKA
jgi:peptidoglycan/xylan/chitin deacetylase (PgdA/CDA1 family)